VHALCNLFNGFLHLRKMCVFYLVPFHRNNDCNKNGSIKHIYKQARGNNCMYCWNCFIYRYISISILYRFIGNIYVLLKLFNLLIQYRYSSISRLYRFIDQFMYCWNCLISTVSSTQESLEHLSNVIISVISLSNRKTSWINPPMTQKLFHF
jgi:hypothetical protein